MHAPCPSSSVYFNEPYQLRDSDLLLFIIAGFFFLGRAASAISGIIIMLRQANEAAAREKKNVVPDPGIDSHQIEP
jgi:hypothetical protein